MAASGVYKVGEAAFMGPLDLTAGTMRARLVTASYTPNYTTDASMTTVGAGVGTDQVLTGCTVSSGVFSAAASTWPAVAAGSTVTGVVIYSFVTNDAGSTPVVYVQLSSTLTNGGDLTVNWASAANKIFTLN